MEKEQAKLKGQTKGPQPNKFNLKKPKSISNPAQSPVTNGIKKKIDNLNEDFIKIIEERKGPNMPLRKGEEEE